MGRGTFGTWLQICRGLGMHLKKNMKVQYVYFNGSITAKVKWRRKEAHNTMQAFTCRESPGTPSGWVMLQPNQKSSSILCMELKLPIGLHNWILLTHYVLHRCDCFGRHGTNGISSSVCEQQSESLRWEELLYLMDQKVCRGNLKWRIMSSLAATHEPCSHRTNTKKKKHNLFLMLLRPR